MDLKRLIFLFPLLMGWACTQHPGPTPTATSDLDQLKQLTLCSATQSASPRLNTNLPLIDLDPAFPPDSKSRLVIRQADGKIMIIEYATTEQVETYRRKLSPGACLLASIPPACMVGHYPGESPGRQPCVTPTVIPGH